MDIDDLSQDSLFRVLLDNIYDGVYFTDTARRIFYWNAAAERITGYRREEILGHSCADNLLIHVDDDGRSLCRGHCPLEACLQDREQRQARVYLHHKDGHRVPVFVSVAPIFNSSGVLVGALETFRDMTPEISAIREAESLREMALICPLTGVGNRRYTEEMLEKRVQEAKRLQNSLGLLMIDIDHFKRVNDTFGHEVGDLVLKTLARTLAGAMRSYDFLGRWGGEEFVAILPNVTLEALSGVGNRLLVLVAHSSQQVSNQILTVTVSIGGTLLHPDEQGRELLRRADALMYQSKNSGRNRVTVTP